MGQPKTFALLLLCGLTPSTFELHKFLAVKFHAKFLNLANFIHLERL